MWHYRGSAPEMQLKGQAQLHEPLLLHLTCQLLQELSHGRRMLVVITEERHGAASAGDSYGRIGDG